ncbi:hypothetical protein VPH35_092503 [Triticum aestivum]
MRTSLAAPPSVLTSRLGGHRIPTRSKRALLATSGGDAPVGLPSRSLPNSTDDGRLSLSSTGASHLPRLHIPTTPEPDTPRMSSPPPDLGATISIGMQPLRAPPPESCASPYSLPCLRPGVTISISALRTMLQLGSHGRGVRPTGQCSTSVGSKYWSIFC